MIYYPKDVLERKVRSAKKSNIRYYFGGETISSHYGSLCDGTKECNFIFIYYNPSGKSFNEFSASNHSNYSKVIDMLSELGISDIEFEELLSYTSNIVKGKAGCVYVIKYKDKVICTTDRRYIAFWKDMILNDAATRPINRFRCNDYIIKDGVTVIKDIKDGGVKDTMVEIYDNNVIKVSKY